MSPSGHSKVQLGHKRIQYDRFGAVAGNPEYLNNFESVALALPQYRFQELNIIRCYRKREPLQVGNFNEKIILR